MPFMQMHQYVPKILVTLPMRFLLLLISGKVIAYGLFILRSALYHCQKLFIIRIRR